MAEPDTTQPSEKEEICPEVETSTPLKSRFEIEKKKKRKKEPFNQAWLRKP